jgi:predicted RNase H-like HicB family nuclease
MNIDRYTYSLTWSALDNAYIGLCTEFPSLSWLANSPESALKGIRKVVDGEANDLQAEYAARLANPDLPIEFARNLMLAKAEDKSLSTPFVPITKRK